MTQVLSCRRRALVIIAATPELAAVTYSRARERLDRDAIAIEAGRLTRSRCILVYSVVRGYLSACCSLLTT